jgi:protein TonB
VTAPTAAEQAAPTPKESPPQAAAPQPEADSSAKAPATSETVEPATTPAAAEAKPTEATTDAPPETEAQPVQAASEPAASPVVTAASAPVPAEPLFEPPQLLEGSEPDYPAKSLKRASGERIQLKLLINDKGRISRVLVEHGTRFKDLEAAAVSAVLRWKYRPATENGTAVEAWTTAEFTF